MGLPWSQEGPNYSQGWDFSQARQGCGWCSGAKGWTLANGEVLWPHRPCWPEPSFIISCLHPEKELKWLSLWLLLPVTLRPFAVS